MRSEGYLSIGGGQCVDYALYKRPDLKELYGWSLGNANTWASAAAAAGFVVNHTPAPGAVFQRGGGLGHVGIVQKVNADGSVVISDMNGVAGWGRVGTTTWTAAQAAGYNYIHGR